MIISVTSIRLKSVWHFFRLSLFGLKVSQQAKAEKGFIGMKNTGFGYMHYTMSCWQTEVDAKRFARTGAHAEAMKAGSQIANEVRIYSYAGEHMPDWKEAKQLLIDRGKIFYKQD
jgi:hypothetical protein